MCDLRFFCFSLWWPQETTEEVKHPYTIGGFEGAKRGIAPSNLHFAPCHKSTTISFTECLTIILLFLRMLCRIKLPYNFRVKQWCSQALIIDWAI